MSLCPAFQSTSWQALEKYCTNLHLVQNFRVGFMRANQKSWSSRILPSASHGRGPSHVYPSMPVIVTDRGVLSTEISSSSLPTGLDTITWDWVTSEGAEFDNGILPTSDSGFHLTVNDISFHFFWRVQQNTPSTSFSSFARNSCAETGRASIISTFPSFQNQFLLYQLNMPMLYYCHLKCRFNMCLNRIAIYLHALLNSSVYKSQCY